MKTTSKSKAKKADNTRDHLASDILYVKALLDYMERGMWASVKRGNLLCFTKAKMRGLIGDASKRMRRIGTQALRKQKA